MGLKNHACIAILLACLQSLLFLMDDIITCLVSDLPNEIYFKNVTSFLEQCFSFKNGKEFQYTCPFKVL